MQKELFVLNKFQIGWLLITSPERGLSEIASRREKSIALFVLLVATASITVSSALASSSFAPSHISTLPFDFVANLTLFLLWLFVASAFLHLCASLLGGSGDVKGLSLGLSASLFPFCFATPCSLISMGLGHPALIGTLSLIGLACWIFWLQVILVKKVYNISLTASILSFLIPFLFFYLAGFILLFSGIGKVMSYVRQV
jgi:hypothetical protein